MKTKSTKRALLMSALALITCVSMLVGSTFAWFTDSVTSTNNIIKSGNLDVELEYYDGDSWEKVTATTNVFEKDTLWEPGHTEVVYLKVSNLGTLALKYNLGINIVNEIESISVEGKALRLSDYIEFGAIDNVDTPYAKRDDARKAVTVANTLSTGYTKAGSIEAGAAAQYVALVVYMPETVGNEANYRTGEVVPQIDLGINLMATQFTSEEDSFDNQYDANAMFDGVPAARTTILSKMPVVTPINGDAVTLDTCYIFNTTESYDAAQMNEHRYWHADFVATIDKDITSDDAGLAGQYDSFSDDWLAFELSEFLGDGVAIPAGSSIRMLETAGITMNYEELCDIVKEFSCGAFAVNQKAMEGATLTVELRLYETEGDPNTTTGPKNDETGKYITIGKYSYTFGAKKVADATTLAAALKKGDNIVLADNITLDVAETGFVVDKDINAKLDLNGFNITATSTSDKSVQLFSVNGNLEIVGNGNISLTNDNFAWDTSYRYTAINIRESGVVTLGEGVNIVCEAGSATEKGYGMTYAVDIYTTGTLNVTGASLSSNYIAVRCFYGNSVVNVNSGLITSTNPRANWGIWPQSAPGAVINIASGIDYTTDDYGIYIFG